MRIFKRKEQLRQKEAEAAEQVKEAQAEYERTVQNGSAVSTILSVLFYHAEQNRIVESLQKVARGS